MRSGDLCGICIIGVMGIVRSANRGTVQVQYLKCDNEACGANDKAHVPADSIRRRRRRGYRNEKAQ